MECVERPAVPVVVEQIFLFQGAEKLSGEERVPFSVALQIGDETILILFLQAIVPTDEGPQGFQVEPVQIEPPPFRLAHERRKLLRQRADSAQFFSSVGRDQQDGPVPQVRRDVSQEIDARGVCPTEVLEEDESWIGSAEFKQKLSHVGEERGLVGDGRQTTASEGSRRRRQIGNSPAGREQVKPRTIWGGYCSSRSRNRPERGSRE